MDYSSLFIHHFGRRHRVSFRIVCASDRYSFFYDEKPLYEVYSNAPLIEYITYCHHDFLLRLFLCDRRWRFENGCFIPGGFRRIRHGHGSLPGATQSAYSARYIRYPITSTNPSVVLWYVGRASLYGLCILASSRGVARCCLYGRYSHSHEEFWFSCFKLYFGCVIIPSCAGSLKTWPFMDS